MRKAILTLSAVLMLVAFTFAGCKSSEEQAPAVKQTTKSTAPATGTKKAPTTTAPAPTPAPAPATK